MQHYTLRPLPERHLWQVSLSFTQSEAVAQTLSLPNWVPGSYMIRDFSRHIIEISAACNGRPAALVQSEKNRWHTAAEAGEWQISYTVYAFDMSVRASYLDTQRGFFDGSCLLLKREGFEHTPHTLTLHGLPENWQIATTMPQRPSENAVSVFSPTENSVFQTASYAELTDHPVELGRIERLDFTARGIPHQIALSGRYTGFDRERLLTDVQKICETALAMFPDPAPFREYLFLLHLGDNIYGGLEHLSSTALHADRRSLPPLGMNEPNEAYIQLLGLFSHEYFHAWNVKSVKPAAFLPYRSDTESYTEQLWAFEGITSYYDDLLLVRSGVISPAAYLNLLAKNITRVQQGKGRLKQTLAESSFAAWHKYYKQDENSPNAIVSYYQKGALAALCLDLLIRQRSGGKLSLDTVMQQLYRDWLAEGEGIEEGHWQIRCQEISGLDLSDFFQTALYSTQDLPLAECLAAAGVELRFAALPRSHGGGLCHGFPTCEPVGDFGARYKQQADGIVLTHVFSDGSAEAAGLSPHDKIIACNGFACTDFAADWTGFAVGETVHLHYFRQGFLYETDLTVQAAEAFTALLRVENQKAVSQWLGG
ncbi:MAG: M61 family peptidase [Neisseria sp.]|nr:M61 family peptidase [Neisseria sp.]